eukprot:777325-Amphidinium_carterae.2
MILNFKQFDAQLPATLRHIGLTSWMQRVRGKMRYAWLHSWRAQKLTTMHAGTRRLQGRQKTLRIGSLQDAGAAKGYNSVYASLHITMAYKSDTHAPVQKAAEMIGLPHMWTKVELDNHGRWRRIRWRNQLIVNASRQSGAN